MSTVGDRAALKLTEEAMARARADTENRAPEGANRQAFYAERVEHLVETTGMPIGEAAKIVGEAQDPVVAQGTVQAALYRERRKRGVPSSRPARHQVGERVARADEFLRLPNDGWEPPRELADILSELAASQAQTTRLVGALKMWAQMQERAVEEAKDRAREAVIREIKAAADKL